jgi:DNA-binding transcriptional ArsR family regulator
MSDRSYIRERDATAAEPDACDVVIVDESAVAQVRVGLAADRRAKRTTDIFSALSDPTRFRILNALAIRELCVCDIAAVVDVSQSAVSHQLRVLRNLDLVDYRREGRRAVYRLADEHVRTLISQGLEHADEER